MEEKQKELTVTGEQEVLAPRENGALAYVEQQLARSPQKQTLTLAQRARRGLVWFFAVMLVLSVVSRVANEMLMARVSVSNVSGGVIDQSLTGTGTWVAADEKQQRAAFSGLRIGEVFARAGESITAGAPLYSFETASVEAMLGEIDVALQKSELQIKQLKTGRSDTASGAALTLSQAQRNLATAQEKLTRSEKQIAEDKQKAYNDALFAYQQQTSSRDSELAAANQAVEKATAALDENNEETKKALDAATAALGSLNSKWSSALAEPARDLELAQKDWRSVQDGTYDYTRELETSRDAVASAEQTLETAQFNYEQARKSDGNTNASIRYQVKSMELDMEAKQRTRDALAALLEQNGIVHAENSGTVTKVNAAAGALSTGEAVVTYAPQGLVFAALVEEEKASSLASGDAVTLLRKGKPEQEKLTVAQIDPPDTDGLCRVLCKMQGETSARALDGTQEFLIEKFSEKQNTRVPLGALRQDGTGTYYVLVLSTKETVLGPKQVAARVDVELLFHDEKNAAVQGALSGREQLITASSKPIAAGDSVVLADA